MSPVYDVSMNCPDPLHRQSGCPTIRSRVGLTIALLLSLLAGCGQKSPASAPGAPSSRKSPTPRAAKPAANDPNKAKTGAPATTDAATTDAAAAKSRDRNAATIPPAPPRIYRASDPPPVHDDEQLARVGIHKYASRRLVLYSDIPPEKAKPLPPLMDQAYDAWVEYFGALPPDREGTEFVITGYLIAERALFRETGLLPEDLPPFPHGRNKGLRFWINDQPTDYYRRHLMLHEGTHCYMTAVPHPLVPHLWYMEGMAELFGTHRIDADGTAHFRVLPHNREEFAHLGRIRLIEDERRQGPPRELAAVMKLADNDFLTNPAYAWSWGLCQFLDGHPRYHDRFRKLGHAATTGAPPGEEQELFTTGRADLEEEWLLFAANVCHGYDQQRAAIEFRAGKPLPENEPATIEVAADRGWQSSGVLLEQGKTYTVIANGRFVIANAPEEGDPGSGQAADAGQPDTGQPPAPPWESEPQGVSIRYHSGRPLGMLLGALRSAPQPAEPPRTTLLDVIPLGRNSTFAAPVSGTLYLRVNDDWNALADNAGKVEVRISADPSAR
jgi:hypothetical protein